MKKITINYEKNYNKLWKIMKFDIMTNQVEYKLDTNKLKCLGWNDNLKQISWNIEDNKYFKIKTIIR